MAELTYSTFVWEFIGTVSYWLIREVVFNIIRLSNYPKCDQDRSQSIHCNLHHSFEGAAGTYADSKTVF